MMAAYSTIFQDLQGKQTSKNHYDWAHLILCPIKTSENGLTMSVRAVVMIEDRFEVSSQSNTLTTL